MAQESNIIVKQTAENAAKLRPTDLGGRVRVAHGSYIGLAGATAGSVIELARLPQGARVLPISQLHFEAGQDAALTVKVGDASDDDRYLSGATVGTAAVSILLAANALNDYLTPGEQVVTATIGGATFTVGKKMVFDLYYVVD